jgi:hypothetical protein
MARCHTTSRPPKPEGCRGIRLSHLAQVADSKPRAQLGAHAAATKLYGTKDGLNLEDIQHLAVSRSLPRMRLQRPAPTRSRLVALHWSGQLAGSSGWLGICHGRDATQQLGWTGDPVIDRGDPVQGARIGDHCDGLRTRQPDRPTRPRVGAPLSRELASVAPDRQPVDLSGRLPEQVRAGRRTTT